MKKGSEILVKIEKTEFPSIGIGREGERTKFFSRSNYKGKS